MPPAGSTLVGRSANACDSCRRRKVKCSGTSPCKTCVKQGLKCRFELAGRRGHSEAYVQTLLAQIQQQNEELEQAKSTSPQDIKTRARKRPRLSEQTKGSSPRLDASESTAAHAQTRAVAEPSAIGDAVASVPGSPSSIEQEVEVAVDVEEEGTAVLTPGTDIVAGPAFESRIRSIVRDHATHRKGVSASPDGSSLPLEVVDLNQPGEWHRSSDLAANKALPPRLPKSESFRFFNRFISLMGITQHFLDPRAFSDNLDLMYKNPASRAGQERTLWYIQYLLVMAIGMLIGCPSDGSGVPPGNAYFAEAMRLLPPTYQLGEHGIISVEILCLVSLYLQWCDRRHDAYLYIGSAVRLALALGCALPKSEQRGLSSEICHKTRVWWTAYMLDRRLSAGLGLPTGADERQIRADLPVASAGFQPPLPMVTNIKIARATGEITYSLYGQNHMTHKALVRKIQQLLHTLYDIGGSIPKGLAIDFDTRPVVISRTSASLHLMLFQAIILCLRPIIFQCAKDKVQASTEGHSPLQKASVIDRLSRPCKEAASKSIRIISALKEDRSIALFGYFDLDATFSAAFTLAIMAFVEGHDAGSPPAGLAEAADVLQYLSSAGNEAAQHRLSELRQLCINVWAPDTGSPAWSWLDGGKASTKTAESESMETGLDANSAFPNAYFSNLAEDGNYNIWGSGAETKQNPFFGVDTFGDLPMEPNNALGDIYSSYNDPSLPLTGIDELDWAELTKIFHLKEQ